MGCGWGCGYGRGAPAAAAATAAVATGSVRATGEAPNPTGSGCPSGWVSGSAAAPISAGFSSAPAVRTTSPFSTATWRVSHRCLRIVISACSLMIAMTHENTT